MKKHVLAVLAAAALVGVASAYAANPFADVPTTSWAYQAVTQLAEQGIVIGYPDGYFKGQRNITRYEMAQIIARAMTKEDRVNAEQQAMINKLANEFSAELNNLGVRVSNLEKKVGNVSLTGDARIRFIQVQPEKGENSEKYDARVRIGATGAVNENTWAGIRLNTKMDFGDGQKTANVTFDRLWVKHNFGGISVQAGRYGTTLGDGLAYDNTTDGISLSTQFNKYNLMIGYGYPVDNDVFTREDDPVPVKDLQLVYAQLDGKVANGVNASAYYARAHSNEEMEHFDIYGVSLDANIAGVQVMGSWAKTESFDNKQNNQAWLAGIGYGNYDQAKAGTWGINTKYHYYDKYFAGLFGGGNDWKDGFKRDFKTWSVSASYALADNLGLQADYFFNGKKITDNTKVDNLMQVSLQYQF